MLQSLIQAILSVLASTVERFAREGKKAKDADSDDRLLRRAGGRIRDWMHSRSSGSGKQSGEDRA